MPAAADYVPAGTFVAGIVFGALIVIRVLRAVSAELRRGMRRPHDDPGNPQHE